MTAGSSHRAIGEATGTAVLPRAESTRNSRTMSWAVGRVWASGGRRSAHTEVPSVTR